MGKNLVFMPECHSTNTVASELCQQSNAPEGTLVITDKQTSGRGQRGNQWESQPGMNLTFSLVLKPTFLMVSNQFSLSVATSLAIHDYLTQTCSESIRIKWPNDILVNEFKICGILIENQLLGHQLTNSIVGIGLNVNQQQFMNDDATSLSLETDKAYDLQEALEGLVSCLEVRYLQLRQNKFRDLNTAYLTHLYRLNEEHWFKAGADQFKGEIFGVDEQGRLRVLVEGNEKTFDVKEIAFLD
jgi:BirA family biotin operon repressor/biotin-[acetyl-CoA-carboxylase] ligase